MFGQRYSVHAVLSPAWLTWLAKEAVEIKGRLKIRLMTVVSLVSTQVLLWFDHYILEL